MGLGSELERRFEVEAEREYLGTDKVVNKIQPLISVSVATYQHVNYIQQCIEGILTQKIDFPVELIIGDDGSDDGTTEICKQYAEKYPDMIRLFIRNRQTSHYYQNGKFICRFNGTWCRMSCRGKYIALCEGDDYWTDPLKLQKQVDFLEKNQPYSLVFSGRMVVNKDGKFLREELPYSREYEITNVFSGFIPTTQTMVFRNNPFFHLYFGSHPDIYSGDRTIAYLAAMIGKIYCLPEITAAYRETGTGVWSGYPLLKKVINHEMLLHDFHRRLGWDISNPVYVFKVFDELAGHMYMGIKNPAYLLKRDYYAYVANVWRRYRYMSRCKLLIRALYLKIRHRRR